MSGCLVSDIVPVSPIRQLASFTGPLYMGTFKPRNWLVSYQTVWLGWGRSASTPYHTHQLSLPPTLYFSHALL